MRQLTPLYTAIAMLVLFATGAVIMGRLSQEQQVPLHTDINTYLKEEYPGDQLVKLKPPICLHGSLYYDWEGRESGVAIPVLDEEGDIIPCVETGPVTGGTYVYRK